MRLSLSAKRQFVAFFITLNAGFASPIIAQTPFAISAWQSFVTPASPFQQVLTEFDATGMSGGDVVFDVYAFNGTYLTGSSLWQALVPDITQSTVVRLHPFVVLAPNTQYAMALTFLQGGVLNLGFDVYPDGNAFASTGPTTSFSYAPDDLQGLVMRFGDAVRVVPTPEPTSLVLMASGLLGIGIARARTGPISG